MHFFSKNPFLHVLYQNISRNQLHFISKPLITFFKPNILLPLGLELWAELTRIAQPGHLPNYLPTNPWINGPTHAAWMTL
jgi:hypothetical protein